LSWVLVSCRGTVPLFETGAAASVAALDERRREIAAAAVTADQLLQGLNLIPPATVAVTQQFNTTSSMGRLTLNVLLSFAQFEREVTGERIRDKIAASKRKGMWMGGYPPLGYDVRDRRLVINQAEAEQVRAIYELYLERGSVRLLKRELDRRSVVSKVRISRRGLRSGGHSFYRGALYELLANPIYLGEIRHKGERYPGQHAPILDRESWERVQQR
jgi:site-specific DNA recombinase